MCSKFLNKFCISSNILPCTLKCICPTINGKFNTIQTANKLEQMLHLWKRQQKEDLKSQTTHYRCSAEQDGYSMISKNVPLFHAISELPITLDPARLDEGNGIDNTLRTTMQNTIKVVKMFNNPKLEWAPKRTSSIKSRWTTWSP